MPFCWLLCCDEPAVNQQLIGTLGAISNAACTWLRWCHVAIHTWRYQCYIMCYRQFDNYSMPSRSNLDVSINHVLVRLTDLTSNTMGCAVWPYKSSVTILPRVYLNLFDSTWAWYCILLCMEFSFIITPNHSATSMHEEHQDAKEILRIMDSYEVHQAIKDWSFEILRLLRSLNFPHSQCPETLTPIPACYIQHIRIRLITDPSIGRPMSVEIHEHSSRLNYTCT